MYRKVFFQVLGLSTVLAAAAVALPSSQVFRVRDDCDPATFNAAIGPGACNPNFNGSTTFDEFIEELTDDRDVGAWKFNPDEVGMQRGQRSLIESRAGEFHTFTRVADFGGGVVPQLNELSAAGPPRPECLQNGGLAPPSSTNLFVPAGAAFNGPTAGSQDLPRGTSKWMCCIHPWMKSTVTVK